MLTEIIMYVMMRCWDTGSHSAFKKVYEEPIVLSRQPTATSEEKVIGYRRADEVCII